jgi:hypothetical protein
MRVRLSKKAYSVRRRRFGYSGLERIELNKLRSKIKRWSRIVEIYKSRNEDGLYNTQIIQTQSLLKYYFIQMWRIIKPPPEATEKLSSIKRADGGKISIDKLVDDDIRELYRFESKQQLYDLLEGFQFPETLRSKNGNVYTREEVLLLGLYRLHFPNKFTHYHYKVEFGMDNQRASECFSVFLDHQFYIYIYIYRGHKFLYQNM